MSQRILIADQDYELRRTVKYHLQKEGFDVTEAQNGKEALEIFFKEQNFDLVITEVMMLESDGWALCREIRKKSAVPIIFFTTRSTESDELFGFELGADDFIKKPFRPSVFVARIKARLGRYESPVPSKYSFQGLEINPKGHNVMLNGKNLPLRPKEYKLLLYLVENRNNALSRSQILNAVWNYDYDGYERTIDTHIKKLRHKLKDKRSYIKTVRNYGYKFAFPVSQGQLALKASEE